MVQRWGYKTVHFAMKKEGLLGGSFLDESEIEQELNEFGRTGWELISVLEMQDGVIAFFKQPLGVHDEIGEMDDYRRNVDSGSGRVRQTSGNDAAAPIPRPMKTERVADQVPVEREEMETPASNPTSIGAIRIE